ncbi:hypothetical protein WN944_011176 [Citrus x changshan-huyou]|uniref:DUF868 family protein n=4 Tax=Citrus TaxID=2706 RepID=A0ACB8N7U7_CITSI|nr:uncharacterized protein LOC102629245 [Citrus sinensis]KAH9745432.1 DUF868 family protein [Citrus sinensis]KAH9793836.1 DUF868 family protein [Citrus sinensis]KDO51012.1 hypothetical protein CISIN_1g047581mg [Citrus sinensis]GAY55126.1 hypothetical protein CUMW_162020 [Citrus unshiu]
MAFPIRAYSMANPPLAEKITEDPVTNKTAQSTVTCGYQTHIAGYLRNVTVLWCKNLMNHSLSIMINSLEGDYHYSCKVDLKPWHFWSKKGYKSLDVEGNQVEIYWDLRSAKFSGGPEPCGDFYVALVWEEEVVLLLGDYKKKAYKRTKARPALVEALQYYKKENVFAKKSFGTRAKFDERKREHDIVVESSTLGPKDPEMWISIDGIVLVHVRNLQWKFRGNQTVLVDKQPVQVFWDVHDWLFSTPGTGHGLFIFKPNAPEISESEGSSQGGGDSDNSNGSKYHSSRNSSRSNTAPEFCLFLYAWKIE